MTLPKPKTGIYEMATQWSQIKDCDGFHKRLKIFMLETIKYTKKIYHDICENEQVQNIINPTWLKAW